jgi:hypothetical protein
MTSAKCTCGDKKTIVNTSYGLEVTVHNYRIKGFVVPAAFASVFEGPVRWIVDRFG